jgi:uncharacterized protein with PIN domain
VNVQPRTATLRFYAELNDFLPARRRHRTIHFRFDRRTTVKDAIEAFGVPHVEVEVIVVGDSAVGFDHELADGDRVAVYPMFEAIDVSPIIRLRERPLRTPRFVLDTHLGKLARLLRLLGFDTLYRNDYDDPEIVRISVDEHRIALTRDRGILKYADLTHGYCVRSLVPEEQAREVVARFDLAASAAPFTRCTMCNYPIAAIAKDEIEHRVGTQTFRDHERFGRCPGCDRIYWEGSQFDRLERVVERLLRAG